MCHFCIWVYVSEQVCVSSEVLLHDFCPSNRACMNTTFRNTPSVIVCSLFFWFAHMLKRLSIVSTVDVVFGRNHFNWGHRDIGKFYFNHTVRHSALGVTVCVKGKFYWCYKSYNWTVCKGLFVKSAVFWMKEVVRWMELKHYWMNGKRFWPYLTAFKKHVWIGCRCVFVTCPLELSLIKAILILEICRLSEWCQCRRIKCCKRLGSDSCRDVKSPLGTGWVKCHLHSCRSDPVKMQPGKGSRELKIEPWGTTAVKDCNLKVLS